MKVINQKSNIFIAAMLVGTIFYFISPLVFRARSNLNFLFSDKTDFFMDFFNTNKYVSRLDPYKYGVHGNYPPLAYAMIFPFSRLYDSNQMTPAKARTDQKAILSYVVFIVVSFVVLGLLLSQLLFELPDHKKIVIIILLILSTPSIFLIERGNSVIIALITLLLFVVGFESDNRLSRELSLIALAISISLKIYPAFFVLLLFQAKRWKDIVKLVFYLIVMFVVPSLLFKGGVFHTIPSFVHNLILQVQFYGSDDYRAVAYHVSIPAFSRMTTMILNGGTSLPIHQIISIILMVIYMIFGIWTFLLSSVFWKKLLILVSLMILIPSISGLYNLNFYFIPLVYYLRDKQPHRLDPVYAILFAMLLFPKQYFTVLEGIYLLDSNTVFTNIIAICLVTLLLVDCFQSKHGENNLASGRHLHNHNTHLYE